MEEVVAEIDPYQLASHRAALTVARTLDQADLLDRLKIVKYDDAGFIPTEVVITLWREARAVSDTLTEHRFVGCLVDRMDKLARAYLYRYFGPKNLFPDLDEAVQDLVVRVFEILLGKPSGAIHAERRFGQFFKRRVCDFLTYHNARKREPAAPFSELGGEREDGTEIDLEDSIEALQDWENDPVDLVADRQQQQCFRDARQRLHDNGILTEMEFRALVLRFDYDLPLESKHGGPCVAGLLKKTPRMVHNYLVSGLAKFEGEFK